ncbi:MBL fold metallo-hydrolase [Heliobacillus mobilis]|uniref:MBL fold metallo-hydrolase n=1 Tax=Heliobacterium mobile TaxID=28064 RepID=A0A6I3SPX9_HELMO|nr:MBL fold metallo-hydrolase [Heliobacterium mobile]MTV51091.1 MBL fold metallo-hydrolase [Heliobacterium mobile]
MKIADGIEMLSISAMVLGRVNTIYPTLLYDNETVLLVDTGFPGQLPLLREAIEKAGIPYTKLNKVIITHQDIDHIGNLAAIQNESPYQIEVFSSEQEKPFIQGEKRLVKMMKPEAIEKAVESLPKDLPEEMRKAFKYTLENPPKGTIDRVVEDGQILPYCGGITVILTPGHTPGHVCLYHQPSKTLIAGDAMNLIDGQLTGPNPQYTNNVNEAFESLKKLNMFDIERVISYHGGLFQGNVNQSIEEITKNNI